MTQTIRAVFEGGVLRPLEPLRLSEQQEVTLRVEESGKAAIHPVDRMTARISDETAEQMLKAIREADEVSDEPPPKF